MKIIPNPSTAEEVTSDKLSFSTTDQPSDNDVQFARSNRYLAHMESEFRRNLVDVKQHLGMLTRNIRTQIDRGRGAPILQNSPIYPASQPTATPRPSFGQRGLRGWRQQPNNHVALASTTGESSQRLPKCTNCLQLGHQAQTCPRLHTAQPPTQHVRRHVLSSHQHESLGLRTVITPRTHNAAPTPVLNSKARVMPRVPNNAPNSAPEPQVRTAIKEKVEISRRFCCSHCGVLYHTKLQCPSLPCRHCGVLGHVSANCKVRQGARKEKRRKSQAKRKAKEALIPRKHLGGSQRPGESPARSQASTRQIPLTAANQPAQIKVDKIPEFHYKQRPGLEDPSPYIRYPNEEMAEEMETDSDDQDEESD